VVVIVEGNEPERLHNVVCRSPPRMQHFRHAMHRSRLGVEGNLDKTAFFQSPRHVQQSARHRDSLNSCLGTFPIFQFHQGRDGISKLDAGCATRRVRLGEVSHSRNEYAMP